MANDPQPRTLDAGALKALAHPLRVRIFDLLSVRGPQTASSLAALVGETSGSTSYHLRALAAHDLIHEVEGRGTGRERWWERPKGRIDFDGPDDAMTPAARAVAQIVTAEFFRLRHETLMNYLNRRQDESLEQWRDAALLMSTNVDMTLAQVEELKAELTAVMDRAISRFRGQTGPDMRRVALHIDLFDVAETPVSTHAAAPDAEDETSEES
jgi:DNA-binding transcriptional ArsR family regulator